MLAVIIYTIPFCLNTFKFILTLQFPLKEVFLDLPKPKPNAKLRELQRAQMQREFSHQFWKVDLPILAGVILAASISLAIGIITLIIH